MSAHIPITDKEAADIVKSLLPRATEATSPPVPADLAGAIAHLTTWSEVSAKMEGDHPSVLVTSIRTVLDRLRLADGLATAAEPFAAEGVLWLTESDSCIADDDLIAEHLRGSDGWFEELSVGHLRALAEKLSAYRGGAK